MSGMESIKVSPDKVTVIRRNSYVSVNFHTVEGKIVSFTAQMGFPTFGYGWQIASSEGKVETEGAWKTFYDFLKAGFRFREGALYDIRQTLEEYGLLFTGDE